MVAGNGEYYETRLRQIEQRQASDVAKLLAEIRKLQRLVVDHGRQVMDEVGALREFVAERLPKAAVARGRRAR